MHGPESPTHNPDSSREAVYDNVLPEEAKVKDEIVQFIGERGGWFALLHIGSEYRGGWREI